MAPDAGALAETTSLCPTCLERVPGRYVAEDGSVQLDRDCPEHGRASRTVWDSADHWEYASGFGPEPAPDGDLTVAHDHACLAVVEVTERCNLSCSYCFASSGPSGHDRPFDEVVDLLETVKAGGGPRPIQFSGGEPTVRDDLPELVETAVDLGFSHVQVNTNGIVLADEDGYAEQLVEAGVTAIYLQFDGLEAETYEATRGVDLVGTKRDAIEACRAADLPVVLVPTVVPGVNDHEMGAVVEFALEHRDVVRSVNFQPVAHFGRYAEHHGRFSLDTAAERLADQLAGLAADDLLPVPCCSGTCQLATAIVEGDGGVVALTSYLGRELATGALGAVDEADWLELMAGTPTGGDRAIDIVGDCCGIDLGSDDGCCTPAAAGVGGCCGDDRSSVPVPEAEGGLVDELLEAVIPVSLTGFMDADAADVGRLTNCCISVPTPDGELVPFCGYNMTTEAGEYALRNRHGWGGRESVHGPATEPAEAPEPVGDRVGD